MGRLEKVLLVGGGYATAIVAWIVGAWLYNVRVSALPYDTSGGMYAFGELTSSLAAFLVVALPTTALWLWFLRGNHGFWNVVGIACVAFAASGLLAVLSTPILHTTPSHIGSLLLDVVKLAQLLGVPFWLAAFAMFAFLAPSRESRLKLMIATAIELVIGVCALVHWLVPRAPI